ncbi:MAG: Holliday junction resolvase RuvX [Puniceicoccaceae bacterium]
MTARESWLAIDYGARRIGLAHADEVGVPVPLAAAVEAAPEERLAHIGRIIAERKVRAIVLGYPAREDGTAGEMAREVETFRDGLVGRFGLPVHLCDERLSSVEAGRHWNLKKARRKRKTGRIDSAAAAIILRDFLETRGGGM